MPSRREPGGSGEAVGIGVLAAEREDRLADRARCRSRAGGAPNAAWATVAPGLGRLVLHLDHLRDQAERVGAQAGDRLAVQRLGAEQDRLAEAELVDPADVVGGQRPAQVGGVAAGDDGQRGPAGAPRPARPGGTARPSCLVGHDAALAGQVGAERRRSRSPGRRRTSRASVDAGRRPARPRAGRRARPSAPRRAVVPSRSRRPRGRSSTTGSVLRLSVGLADDPRRPG